MLMSWLISASGWENLYGFWGAAVASVTKNIWFDIYSNYGHYRYQIYGDRDDYDRAYVNAYWNNPEDEEIIDYRKKQLNENNPYISSESEMEDSINKAIEKRKKK